MYRPSVDPSVLSFRILVRAIECWLSGGTKAWSELVRLEGARVHLCVWREARIVVEDQLRALGRNLNLKCAFADGKPTFRQCPWLRFRDRRG